MKRKMALLLLALAVGYSIQRGGLSSALNTLPQQSEARRPSGLPTGTATMISDTVETESAAPVMVAEEEIPAVLPRLYFPDAKVIARHVSEPDAEGRVRVTKTVEAREKLVRIDEVYEGGSADPDHLMDQVAMVANEVLAQRPDSMGEAEFLSLLERVGALKVKKTGAAFLVTFTAEPRDPRAVESFRERLSAELPPGAVVEPNYIRRLL